MVPIFRLAAERPVANHDAILLDRHCCALHQRRIWHAVGRLSLRIAECCGVGNGQDERTQMHSMSYLLDKCEGMSNRELIDDATAWVQQGTEQEQREEQV